MKKQVMVRAWEVAREGVKKFGGKVKDFFKAALTIAWAEVKEGTKVTLKELQALASKAVNENGARDYEWNKWSKEGYNRIYINLVSYRKNRKIIKDCGYVDLNTMEYIADSKYSVNVLDLIANTEINTRNESNKYQLAK